MGRKMVLPEKVILRSNLKVISGISKLEKVGAGHDGIVFRFNDNALKILKYDINLRRQRNLMTFEKILYFQDELNLGRIIQPRDILLDFEGVYSGYVMDCLDNLASSKKEGTSSYKRLGDFLCEDLIEASYELEDDFNELTEKRVVAKDINRGSYIYTDNFLHLCDMDKYLKVDNKTTLSVSDENKKMCNFVIAKALYYEMQKLYGVDKTGEKQLNNWVKKSSNSRTFMQELRTDLAGCADEPLHDYVLSKAKKIVR